MVTEYCEQQRLNSDGVRGRDSRKRLESGKEDKLYVRTGYWGKLSELTGKTK
jgi:hypothetical protein